MQGKTDSGRPEETTADEIAASVARFKAGIYVPKQQADVTLEDTLLGVGGEESFPVVGAYCPERVGIGDIASTAKGSGARYNSMKTKWSLMPLDLLKEVCDVWEYGANKYAAWNWAKGMPWSVPYECIVRHLFRWYWHGERNDPESGKSHLAHIVCNVMMLMHYDRAYPEGDDRPKEFIIE